MEALQQMQTIGALQTSGTANLSVNRDGQPLITRSWSKSNAIVGQTPVTAEVAATIQTSINKKHGKLSRELWD